MVERALDSIKVLDLSQHISGPYCTKMLAAFGAEVIKVEKPGEGDVARRLGPFPADKPHPERSGLFLYLNTAKQSITLNIESATGRKLLKELVKTTDVLVENSEPRVMAGLGLDYGSLAKVNPRLVVTSITSFGQSGPYRDYKASSIVEYALSGHVYITGEPDREPLQGPGPQPDYQGGLHGFWGTLLALYSREETGRGQHVDVSTLETMAGFHQYTVSYYSYSGEIKRRTGNRYAGWPMVSIYSCQDGYVSLSAPTPLQREFLYVLIGKPELLADPRFQTRETLADNADAFDSLVAPWFRERTKEEIFHACAEMRIPCSPVTSPGELLNDRHYQSRRFWVEIDHPEAGKLTYPGAPFKMSETPWQTGRAPLLGEHNVEIYCDRLGYTRDDLVAMRDAGAI